MDKQLRIVRIICLVAVLGLLVSCARHHPPVAVASPPGEIDIANAAVSVSQSMDKMATTEQRGNPIRIMRSSPEPLDYGMGGLVSIDWTGPIENLVRKIGLMTGYRVKVLGEAPAVPILVVLYEENVPVGGLLREAGLQAKSRAEISVYSTAKVIELRYVG